MRKVEFCFRIVLYAFFFDLQTKSYFYNDYIIRLFFEILFVIGE